MSHRSRVCAVNFDVGRDNYADAAHFWSGALGRDTKFDPGQSYAEMPGEVDYGGQPFCVVPAGSETWPQGAIEWD